MTGSSGFKKGVDAEMQTFRLSEMISEDCYHSMFDLQAVSNEFIAVVGCMKDVIRFETFGIALHKL